MLTRIGLLIALALAAILIVGCGEAKYENATIVVTEASNFKSQCQISALPLKIEQQTDQIDCWIGNVDQRRLEVHIYTFDLNAQDACEQDMDCKKQVIEKRESLEGGDKVLAVRFLDNAMFVIKGGQPGYRDQPNESEAQNLLDTLIADIED